MSYRFKDGRPKNADTNAGRERYYKRSYQASSQFNYNTIYIGTSAGRAGMACFYAL